MLLIENVHLPITEKWLKEKNFDYGFWGHYEKQCWSAHGLFLVDWGDSGWYCQVGGTDNMWERVGGGAERQTQSHVIAMLYGLGW
jgi:hypothetical protein